MENNVYYFSLTRGLQGYYVKVLATSENVVREYASNYFNNNWCSIYTAEDLVNLRLKGYKTLVINEGSPVELNDRGTYE